jgi:hypothetical protein
VSAHSTTTHKPRCDLSDIPAGDCFRLVLRVATTLDRSGQIEAGNRYWKLAMIGRNYVRALELARDYVEVLT